jgi:antitoxin component YwqK of YwqJK toxin-antitoxin module
MANSAIREQGQGVWHKISALEYDESGSLIKRLRYHRNGNLQLETLVAHDGQDSIHRIYSTWGRLIKTTTTTEDHLLSR